MYVCYFEYFFVRIMYVYMYILAYIDQVQKEFKYVCMNMYMYMH